MRFILIFCILVFVPYLKAQEYEAEKEVKFETHMIKKIIDVSRKKSEKIKYIKGFRIQIFSGNYKECKLVENKFRREYPFVKLKRKIENPFYKIWIGAYKDVFMANYDLNIYRKKYKSAILIPSKIYYSEL